MENEKESVIWKEVKKIWCDTLTEDGKYSRKSLTWIISFLCCITMGAVDQIFGLKVNDIVFLGFLGMATGQAALSIWDKKKK